MAYITTATACGMETNPFSIISHGTKITLTKGYVSNADNKVDIIVVGNAQQCTLQKPSIGYRSVVGKIEYIDDHIIYEKNKNADSASDDDTYKPFVHSNYREKKSCQKINAKTMHCTVMSVIEPRIKKSRYYDNKQSEFAKGFSYYAERYTRDATHTYVTSEAHGNEAITQASKDLALCYTKVLTEGLPKLSENKYKSIALPTLSADVGFPREQAAPVAIAAILEFVSNNPNAYNSIALFVKKQSEFALYKTLLTEYWNNTTAKICFLYCAHKNPDHFLSNLPRDIINSITLLMLNT